MNEAKQVDPEQAPFNRHILRLREARRLTQQELADRSDLAADTIRRLEHGDFSPSLKTIRKVSHGLGLSVTELFVSLEMCPGDSLGELVALVAGCPPRVIRLIIHLARVVIEDKPGR